MKNLFLGYFASTKKDDVLKLITSVLAFTDEESSKVESGGRRWMSGWMPSWRGGTKSVPVSPRNGNDATNEVNSLLNVTTTPPWFLQTIVSHFLTI